MKHNTSTLAPFMKHNDSHFRRGSDGGRACRSSCHCENTTHSVSSALCLTLAKVDEDAGKRKGEADTHTKNARPACCGGAVKVDSRGSVGEEESEGQQGQGSERIGYGKVRKYRVATTVKGLQVVNVEERGSEARNRR
ncbi:hypothetical protein E2C01_028804 [Portunus trituberculatus]|uniref:Uncharacterized protein n=1 Tax=Portunus trituberculatus TaxID=210409 RepID=A0A5B7ELM3_PORTR|nr:hypothetical protein [Portunus trituberculatus]